MKLNQATLIAEKLKQELKPHCDRIEIAGSIRRGRPIVHDIDIVLIPKPEAVLALDSLLTSRGSLKSHGPKLTALTLPYEGIDVDIYRASSSTWATLLLIRTGSKENNIRLCSLARKKGWQLKANGEGLFNEKGQRIAGDTEQSIYEALDTPYQEPPEREVTPQW